MYFECNARAIDDAAMAAPSAPDKVISVCTDETVHLAQASELDLP